MSDRLHRILDAFSGKRVLAIGDLMLDEFIWGKVSRISPEAPVPVVTVTGESYYPGGAANVARNLTELSAHTAVIGLVGADSAGCRLLELLHGCGIETAGIQQDGGIRTTVKTRIIARNQQVVRVDREERTRVSAAQAERVMDEVERTAPGLDAIVVADYSKGFLTQPLADHICAVAKRHGTVLAVDPHPHSSLDWRGATAIKPNRMEAFLATGRSGADPAASPLEDEALLEVGAALLEKWQCGLLLITLGEHGMLLVQEGAAPHHIPTRAQEVFDVSGAGDTAIAMLAMALASGANAREAADLANRASGIVVGKLGTATTNVAEVAATLTPLSTAKRL